MSIRLLYSLILFGMGINGALYSAWFLSPPNPGRLVFWYCMYLIVFPLLGLLGIVALALKRELNLSWWVGVLLLVYACIPFGIILVADSILLAWLPEGGFEVLHVVIFGVTLMGLVLVITRR